LNGDGAPGVVVRGVGDIASAVAHRLHLDGHAVVMVDDPQPTTTRRGMAFADAVFDGRAELDGVVASRADDLDGVKKALTAHDVIPVYILPWGPLLHELKPRVLVDARVRKRSDAEVQRGYADMTVGLGPGFVVGRHCDIVIETSWDGLGTVMTDGSALPLTGEPREIGGHARDRYVYAPFDGVFRTKRSIGDVVRQGEVVAQIGSMSLAAPIPGALRGLTRDGVPVTVRAKVIEVDPRGARAEVRGITERPRRIAEGVARALADYDARRGTR
jgi:xanthine dehydrogenase accessory factor